MSHKHTPCLGCDICGICVAEQSIQLVQALEDKHKAYRHAIEDAAKVAEEKIHTVEQTMAGLHVAYLIRALLKDRETP